MFPSVEISAAAIAALCRRYRVKELAVFGSAVRGDVHPGSDIDLLVEFQPAARIGLVEFATLGEELEQLLGRPVDLVTRSGLKPRLRARVLEEAKVVYAA